MCGLYYYVTKCTHLSKIVPMHKSYIIMRFLVQVLLQAGV